MADQTITINATKSAYVKSLQPDTVFPTNTTTNYLLGSESYDDLRRLYFGFDSFPSNLKRNLLKEVRFTAYTRNAYTWLGVRICDGGFDPTTTTWNTKKVQVRSIGDFDGVDFPASVSWSNRTNDQSSSTAKDRSRDASVFAQNLGLFLVNTYSAATGNYAWYAKTVLSGGGSPYVTITYDDATIITSKVKEQAKIQNNFRTDEEQLVSWDLIKDSTYYCADETWVQASAKIYWKYDDDVSWNEIAASGSTQSITIPRYTFESGKTVEYYIEATDTDGTTTQTSTFTVTSYSTQVRATEGPTSGYKNPRTSTRFAGYFSITNNPNVVYTDGQISLFWKVSTDESYTEVPFTTWDTPVVIAANTFPTASTIKWYLSGVDASGAASTTSVYSFSTAAGTAYATATNPIDSIEDGSAPILFTWTLSSTDGQTPTRVQLRWKQGTSGAWNNALDATPAVTSWIAAANTFSAGDIYWEVRAYNVDGTAGPWSTTALHFVCIAAPTIPEGLTSNNVPFLVVTWQSAEQQAYEISIDGNVVETGFGVDVNSWSAEDPLSDGAHEISVRVQGIYGLWSQPAVAYCAIENQPEDGITLTGVFSVDADLNWETESTVNDFRIYRNSKRIGKTNSNSFVDFSVLGIHEWYVINKLASGNYDISNIVTETLATEQNLIADVESGTWLELKLTEKSNGIQNFSKNRQYSLRHFSGAEFPVAEVSPFTDMAASYDAAFTPDDSGAAVFESLFGREVILKSRRGNVMIGVFASFSKIVGDFYTVYTFTLNRIHYEDFRDETNS